MKIWRLIFTRSQAYGRYAYVVGWLGGEFKVIPKPDLRDQPPTSKNMRPIRSIGEWP